MRETEDPLLYILAAPGTGSDLYIPSNDARVDARKDGPTSVIHAVRYS
jgi:hypothetical protein